MSKLYRILFVLHIFVGVGALFGGLMTILNPYDPLGMSVEYLKYSPFKSYLIPGIILFTIIGVGNIVSAIIMRLRLKYQAYTSNTFSWALVIWIVVQCIMLNAVSFIHIIYFVIGLVEGIISISILFEHELFPANLILKFKQKI
ncbi:MAG: hypothetical protein FH761_13915 [Firmicutes bacterium]|nr:hypothetical protein [Bacillota bacterium]